MFTVCVVLVSQLCHSITVVAVIVERPTDVVTKQGSRVVLSCTTSTTSLPVSWSFLPADGRSTIPRTLYVDGKLVSDGYTMMTSNVDGRHDLLIESVRAKHAGRYDCMDENGYSHTEYASAQLVVVSPDLTPSCDVIELSSSSSSSPSSCTDCSALEINCHLQYVGFIADSPIVTWTDPDGKQLHGGANNVTQGSIGEVWSHNVSSHIRIGCDSLQLTLSFVNYTVYLQYDRSYDDDYGDERKHYQDHSAELTVNVAIREPHQVDVCGPGSIRSVILVVTVIIVAGFALCLLVMVVLAHRLSLRFRQRRARTIEFKTSWYRQSLRNSASLEQRSSTALDDVNVYNEVVDAENYQPLSDVDVSPSTEFTTTYSQANDQQVQYSKLHVERSRLRLA